MSLSPSLLSQSRSRLKPFLSGDVCQLSELASGFTYGTGAHLNLPSPSKASSSSSPSGWGFFLGIFYGFFWYFLWFSVRQTRESVSWLTADRAVSQSESQPSGQSVSQSVSQPSGQSVSRSAGSGESVSQSVGRPAAAVSQSASQYVYQPSRQSVGLLIWRYTCKPVSMEYRNRQMSGRV